MPFGKLLHAHMQWLEDDVLRIIDFPVARQDASLFLKPKIQRRSRKWCQHGKARQINAGIDGKLNRSFENIRCVMVETKNETALY